MTLPFNMCSRCPVLVVPCGRSRDGVPLGVQIVGRTYDDVSVFRAAAAFAAATPWFDDARTGAQPRRGASHEPQPTLAASPRCLLVAVAVLAVAPRPSARRRPSPPAPRRRRRAGKRSRSRIGWTTEPDNLNPFIGWQNATYEIWAINYDFLFGFGAQRERADARPRVASSRRKQNGGISPDGKVWTIKLRPGVKWSDGQPLTADDVAFTYNYIVKNQMLNMAHRDGRHQRTPRSLAPDVVQITCSQPKADMEHIFLPILPKHVWEQRRPQGGPDQLRQQAADRRHRPLHHHGVQEGRLHQDGPQPLLLGQEADRRRDPLPQLHQRRLA